MPLSLNIHNQRHKQISLVIFQTDKYADLITVNLVNKGNIFQLIVLFDIQRLIGATQIGQYNQIMNITAGSFIKYISIAGGLSLAYATINYFGKLKSSSQSSSLIALDTTRKIIQQIKYQMYTVCISFAQGAMKLKGRFSAQELDDYLRKQMAKIYEQKKDLILSKFVITKEELVDSLLAHKNDKDIIRNQNEMTDMIQRAIRGEIPDLTVPQKALKLMSMDQIQQVYREICQLISEKVWQLLQEKNRNDPSFNYKDDAQFKEAIRLLNIFDFKKEYLKQIGFRQQWGCPNEIFLKVLETKKRQNQEFKAQIMGIQESYTKLIQLISYNPEQMNKQKIINFMHEQN